VWAFQWHPATNWVTIKFPPQPVQPTIFWDITWQKHRVAAVNKWHKLCKWHRKVPSLWITRENNMPRIIKTLWPRKSLLWTALFNTWLVQIFFTHSLSSMFHYLQMWLIYWKLNKYCSCTGVKLLSINVNRSCIFLKSYYHIPFQNAIPSVKHYSVTMLLLLTDDTHTHTHTHTHRVTATISQALIPYVSAIL
jgi:hypothetical protein